MSKRDDSITLKFDGKAAKQLRDLRDTLDLDSPGAVVMQALSILTYSIGSEIKIEKKGKVLKFEQFADKKPLPVNFD